MDKREFVDVTFILKSEGKTPEEFEKCLDNLIYLRDIRIVEDDNIKDSIKS